MVYQEVLVLKSDQQIQPDQLKELGLSISKQGFELYFLNLEIYCIDKCREMTLQQGTTSIVSLERYQETVLAKAVDRVDRDLLLRILRYQLQHLSPSEDLIIVDPYFFSPNIVNTEDYLNIFKDVFTPFIPCVEQIYFITSPNYNECLYLSMKQIVIDLNPDARVFHRTTADFHDRFWIVDRKKGIFVGTSLNGIGKKYALTDYIKEEDIEIIVENLKLLKLI